MKTGTTIALIGIPIVGVVAWVAMSGKAHSEEATKRRKEALLVKPRVEDNVVFVDNIYGTYLWAQNRASVLGFTGDSDTGEVVKALFADLGVSEDGGIVFQQFPKGANDDELIELVKRGTGMPWKEASAKTWSFVARKIAELRKRR